MGRIYKKWLSRIFAMLLAVLMFLPANVYATSEKSALEDATMISGSTIVDLFGNKRINNVNYAGYIKAVEQNIQVIETLYSVDPKNFISIEDIDLQPEQIKELTEAAKKIVGKEKDASKKIKLVHDWMAKNIYFDYGSSDIMLSGGTEFNSQQAYDVFKAKKAVCDGFANLTRALLRTVDVPCTYVDGSGGFENYDTVSSVYNHAWNAAYDGKRWIIFDTSWDTGNAYQDGKWNKGEMRTNWYDMNVANMSIDHVSRYLGYDEQYIKIGDYAYRYGRDGLALTAYMGKDSDVVVPEKVNEQTITELASFFFWGGEGVKSITLPESVEIVDYYCLSYLEQLEKLTFLGKNPPLFRKDTLQDINPLCKIYVPEESLELYKEALAFTNLEVLPASK